MLSVGVSCSSLFVHRCLLFVVCVIFGGRCGVLFAVCCLCVGRCVLIVVWCLLLVVGVCCLLCVVSLCAVCCLLFGVNRRLLSVACCLSFVALLGVRS